MLSAFPDHVFSKADRFAQTRKMSRSALFTIAVEEYIQHHLHANVTEKLNEVYANTDSSMDPVLDNLQTLSLPKEDW